MKIARNKPIPEVGSGRPRAKRFDLLEKIGDSFLIKGDPRKLRGTIYSSLSSYNLKAKTPIGITTRTEDGGIRVWRIK